jgi:membrane protein implicated in regulation of membrane protease activity
MEACSPLRLRLALAVAGAVLSAALGAAAVVTLVVGADPSGRWVGVAVACALLAVVGVADIVVIVRRLRHRTEETSVTGQDR